MPYNTRRKSLSLPSLGIQLPPGSRGRDRPPSTAGEQPPQKRVKRTYSVPIIATTTPPPSPPPEGGINREGVNDDIVSGVIDILDKSGNRPHTVKELAALLSPTLGIVENSANPHAIISSRLNAYLKRGFSPSSPCLLAKELITSHPRRIYFYLTTCPSQPIPETESPVLQPRRSVISPVSDDEGIRRRTQLSPSPEVDLSSPEFDDYTCPPSPIDLVHGYHGNFLPRDRTVSPIERKHTLSTTPLEGDEQEFTQSAIQLKQRSVSREYEEQRRQKIAKEQEEQEDEVKHDEGSESEDAAALLGYAEPSIGVGHMNSFTSTLVRDHGSNGDSVRIKKEPSEMDDGERTIIHGEREDHDIIAAANAPHPNVDIVQLRSWAGDMQSPESIELDELDDLLGAEFQ